MPDQCFCHERAIARGLCDKHFQEQRIDPLRKERANSEAIVRQLTVQIEALEAELGHGYAREQLTEKDAIRVHCHKCGKIYPLSQVMNCMDHERNCTGARAHKSKGAGAKAPKAPSVKASRSGVNAQVEDDYDNIG